MLEMTEHQLANCSKIPTSNGEHHFYCTTNSAKRFDRWDQVDSCLFHLKMKGVNGSIHNCDFWPGEGDTKQVTVTNNALMTVDTVYQEGITITHANGEKSSEVVVPGKHEIGCQDTCTVQIGDEVFLLHKTDVNLTRVVPVYQTEDFLKHYFEDIDMASTMQTNATVFKTKEELDMLADEVEDLKTPTSYCIVLYCIVLYF